MKRHFIRLFRLCWYALAATVVVAAALVLLARTVAPLADRFRPDVEAMVAEHLGAPVRISRLALSWEGLGPRLRLQGLSLLDPEDGETLLKVDRGELRVGFARPLWPLRYRVRDIDLYGLVLTWARGADGAVRFLGLGNEAGGRLELTAEAWTWLLEVETLHLREATVIVQVPGARHRLEPVDLRWRGGTESRHLRLQAALPPSLGRSLTAIARLEGATDDPGAWRGRVYLETEALRAGPLLALLPAGAEVVPGADGRLDLQAWLEWEQGRPRDGYGRFALRELNLGEAPAPTWRAQLIAGSADWRASATGWSARLAELRVVPAEGAEWPLRRADLALRRAEEGGAATLRLVVDRVQLRDLAGVRAALPVDTELDRWLAELAPEGRVDGFWVEQAGGDLPRFGGAVADLGIRSWRSVPAVHGVDAVFAGSTEGLDVAVDSRRLRLDFPGLFRDPLHFTQVAGLARLEREGSGLRLRAERVDAFNEHLIATARLDLRLPAEGSPFLDMQSTFREGRGEHKSLYLPTGIMSTRLVRWLDQAIVSARVPEGGLLLYGPLAEFPFYDSQGVFDVDFRVEDGRLRYLPDWPEIQGLAANVRFYGPGLQISGEDGRVFRARLPQVRARIPDLARAVLEVEGRGRGPLNDYLRFIEESPLREILGPFFAGARGTGEPPLELKLSLPLHGAERLRVSGAVDFHGQRLRADRFDLDLQDLHGRIRFTDASFEASAVRARLRGAPVVIQARTDQRVAEPLIRFTARGRFSVRQLLPGVALPLERWFVGRSPWKVEIEVPAVRGGRHGGVILRAESDLRGVHVALPAPLAKPEAQPTQVRVLTRLADADEQWVDLVYGDRLRSRFELRHDGGQTSLGRGVVTTRASITRPARSLPERGWALGGRLDWLDLDAWQALGSDLPPSADGPWWPRLAVLDLYLERAVWSGYEMQRILLTGGQREDHLRLVLESPGVGGHFLIPWPGSGRALQARVRHLDLSDWSPPQPESPGEGIDPRTLPPLDLAVERLTLNDRTVRNLVLRTRPKAGGQEILELGFRNPELNLAARGEWVMRAIPPHDRPRHATQLTVALKTQDLGKGLRELGYQDALREGRGSVTGQLQWRGALYGPDLDSLGGRLRFDLRDGRLISVDPGMGRIFGLLSLQALPRRLSLDFKDMLVDGFSYDSIAGNLHIVAGHARTEDLTMIGPSATVSVHGRTGLATRDYDQTVEVRPHVVSSLPVVGTLTGGLGTGIAVLLLERVARGLGVKVEDIAKLTYTLTGPWDAPKIEQINQAPDSTLADPFDR